MIVEQGRTPEGRGPAGRPRFQATPPGTTATVLELPWIAELTKRGRAFLEQPVEIIDPLERKTTETFDAAGNLKTEKDPNGGRTPDTVDLGTINIEFANEIRAAWNRDRDERLAHRGDQARVTLGVATETDTALPVSPAWRRSWKSATGWPSPSSSSVC